MISVACPAPGIYPGVRFEEYQAWPALNISTLKHAARSAKHLKAALDGAYADNDTPARRKGRAYHCELLEPKDFDARFPTSQQCCAILASGQRKGLPCANMGTYYEFGNWYCGQHETGQPVPRDYVTPSELADVKAMAHSVKNHAAVRLMRQQGGCEISWLCEIQGVLMKGRIDKLIHESPAWPCSILDLKKVQVGSLGVREIGSAAAGFGYHAQMACYREALQILGEARSPLPESYGIFAEDGPPYDLVVYRYTNENDGDTSDLSVGLDDFHHWLGIYQEGLATGKWPGVSEDIRAGVLPSWKLKQHAERY